MSNKDAMKQAAAQAALAYIEPDSIVGVGTGSTTNFFIDGLAKIKGQIEGAVASSIASAERLAAHGIAVLDLNSVGDIPIYVDGADEFNTHRYLIKGGGGALTREKIIASAARQFVCIVDQNKQVDILGQFPLAIEVIPMARSYVARELTKLGGQPIYREQFVTDNNNVILDVHGLDMHDPIALDQQLNNIAGVVCHGLFAKRRADTLLVAQTDGSVQTL